MFIIRIHTVLDPVSGLWHNRVDNVRAGFGAATNKADAIAAGREEAMAIGGVHVVHNEDGTICRRESFARTQAVDGVTAR